jgi:hypothetical protein
MPIDAPVGTVLFHQFEIDGKDLRPYLAEVKIFESMLRPFIVCDFTLRDFDGIGSTLRLTGGEPVYLRVTSREDKTIRWRGYVTKQSGDIDLEKKKIRGTTITATSAAYVYNEVSKVTKDFKGITGTQAIQEIHNQYLGGERLHRILPSMGMLAEQEPYHIRDEKPFDAISKIRYAITSAAYPKTGAYTYYRDIDGQVLMPLEGLFNEAASGAIVFTERETIGSAASDVFATNDNIIDFKAMTTFSGSASGMAAIAQAVSRVENDMWQHLNVNNFVQGTPQTVSIPNLGGGLFNLTRRFGNSLSSRNYPINDKRINRISPQSVKAAGEKVTAEMVQNGPGYKMAVLFDLGAFLTVGRGVIAEPLVQREDGQPSDNYREAMGGLGLIVNLTHTLKNIGETRVQGVTVVECAQGGFRR